MLLTYKYFLELYEDRSHLLNTCTIDQESQTAETCVWKQVNFLHETLKSLCS